MQARNAYENITIVISLSDGNGKMLGIFRESPDVTLSPGKARDLKPLIPA